MVDSPFKLQEADVSFICQELSKLQTTKSTGIDGIPARLLRDASVSIAMPVTKISRLYLVKFQLNGKS